MPPSDCPPEDVLGRYAAGTLPDAEVPAIEVHLDRCTTCLSWLDSRANVPDPLVAALRGPAPAPVAHPELAGAVAAVLARQPDQPALSAPPVAVGAVVNGYRLLEVLGHGGMGRV